MDKKNLFKKSFKGFVLGDCLGAGLEFYKDGFKPFQTEMIEISWFQQPKGTFTDDTSLTLATMDGLSEGLDFENIMKKYVTYLDGRYTIDNECFDIGLGTENALKLYKKGDNISYECGSPYEENNGNGAMMRIMPLAFTEHYYDGDLDTRFDLAKKITTMTHGHQYSIVGSFMYLETIKLLSEKEYSDFNNVLYDLKNIVEPYINQLNNENYTIAFNQYKDIFNDDFVNYGVRGSGYVVDTFRYAIQTILKHDNFKDCILHVANYGGDNDTVGAICGSMAMMFYDYTKYPSSWEKDLRGKDILLRYQTKFLNSL